MLKSKPKSPGPSSGHYSAFRADFGDDLSTFFETETFAPDDSNAPSSPLVFDRTTAEQLNLPAGNSPTEKEILTDEILILDSVKGAEKSLELNEDEVMDPFRPSPTKQLLTQKSESPVSYTSTRKVLKHRQSAPALRQAFLTSSSSANSIGLLSGYLPIKSPVQETSPTERYTSLSEKSESIEPQPSQDSPVSNSPDPASITFYQGFRAVYPDLVPKTPLRQSLVGLGMDRLPMRVERLQLEGAKKISDTDSTIVSDQDASTPSIDSPLILKRNQRLGRESPSDFLI